MVAAVEIHEFSVGGFGGQDLKFLKHSGELLNKKSTWSMVIFEELVVSKS